MTCANCKHLKIIIQPVKGKGGYYELGVAECKKYNLITDFTNMSKFRNLTCPEEYKEERGEE